LLTVALCLDASLFVLQQHPNIRVPVLTLLCAIQAHWEASSVGTLTPEGKVQQYFVNTFFKGGKLGSAKNTQLH